MGRPAVVTTVIIVLAGVALTAFYGAAGFERVLSKFEDDSFYYLAIAARLAHGQSSTFDGLHPTNGYHPLWCWTLIPVMYVLDSPETATRGVAILCVWLRVIAALLLFFVARRAFGNGVVAGMVAVCFFAFGNSYGTNGMEEALQMLCLTAFLFLFGRGGTSGYRWLLTPLVLGLLALSRLDSVFIAGAYFAWRGWSACFGDAACGRRREMAIAAGEVALFGCILAGYLASNLYWHDSLVPISGKLKSSFPHLVEHEGFFSAASPFNKLLIVQTVALAVFILLGLRNKLIRRITGWADVRQVTGIAFWVIGEVAVLAYTMLFGRWAVAFGWYYQVFAFVGALALGQWLLTAATIARLLCTTHERAVRRGQAVAAVVVASALGVWVCGKHVRVSSNTDYHILSYRAATWVNANLPADAILAMKDCGVFGFFCGRSVINLDGVVNNVDYQRRLCRDGIATYLQQEGVDYYVAHSLVSAPEPVRAGTYDRYERRVHRSVLFGCDAGPVTLYAADEVYRDQYFNEEPTAFAIWRLHQYRAGPAARVQNVGRLPFRSRSGGVCG